MEHAQTPENYYSSNIWQDSPLTDNERETLRDAIRTLILGIEEEIFIKDITHSAIQVLELTCFRDHPDIGITVYLDPLKLDTKPITEEYFGDDPEHPEGHPDPHYLRDLGHEMAALEYDLLNELVIMLDLPEHPSELAPYVGQADQPPHLLGTFSNDNTATFVTFAHIPHTTTLIYESANFELARQLGIPLEK